MDQASPTARKNDLGTLFTTGAVGRFSDAQLLERFAQGTPDESQAAFEAVIQRYGPIVLGVCRRVLRDPSTADDVFQATFLVLALKRSSIIRRESLGPWLHGVAFRIAQRARAFAKDRREVPLTGGDIVGRDPQDAGASELREVLDAELSRLPEKYRRPIVLCFLEGRTQEEAASVLGWTKGTVSGRLARAKDLLKTRLVRRGLAPSVGLVAHALTPESASAAVPVSLVSTTARAAWALALGHGEAITVSGAVSMLTRVGTRALAVSQVKMAAATFAVVGAIACGAYAVSVPASDRAEPAQNRVAAAQAPAVGDAKKERAPVNLDPKRPFGTIKGRLVWDDENVPAPVVLQPQGRSKKDPLICAIDGPIVDARLVIDAATKGIRYAFVYLVNPVGTNEDAYRQLIQTKKSVILDQKACIFVPHAIAMHEDQALEVRSTDPINHNVNIKTFINNPQNYIMTAGKRLNFRFMAERRPVQIVCDIHPWMSAYLMIFNHPFFAVTAADGSFEIPGVPAAEQRLVVWQETKGYVTPERARGMAVEVNAGKVTDLGEIRFLAPKDR